ncbi:MAG TPA: lipid-A-disaccharide synthase [Lentisphaeria bacterium]|nr:MAG: lipid-A-disaccharide synthase [Lentisphaerae bacterium GWF2_38_69]HBM15980.1 lipid-A-disaccharide synthase [Lentisphaeria bacterium]
MSGNKRNIWIVAGETSGDLYGAALAESLKKLYPDDLTISGMGGNAMKDSGVDIFIDSTELGIIGFVEVLKSAAKLARLFRMFVKKAKTQRPDAVILINYPGFNLRLAKKMHRMNIKVIWYISPHIWVWGKKRIYKLARYCNKMLVIFPFEVDYYKAKTNLDVEFVGHPLLDIVKGKIDSSIKRDQDKLLIIPGSRLSEIERILVPFLEAALIIKQKHPSIKLIISSARPAVEKKIRLITEQFMIDRKVQIPFEIESGNNLQLMQQCSTGLAKSGTVTMEAAIIGLPLVVYYRLNPITFFLAKHILIRKLFRNSFVMPNIIANNAIYEEFLQNEGKPEILASAVERILPGGNRRDYVIAELNKLRANQLSYDNSNASDNAAKAIKSILS